METPRRVLVIGSGAIKIAEAAEFDYSGSQALKALKEEGIETILVNPNVATIQTDHRLADRIYLVPLTPEFVEAVIERERPDAILLGFGGQTALSLGVKLHRLGVLQRYGVRVLGTPIEGIERALDRGLFRKTMEAHGLPVPPSRPVKSVEEALEAADEIGYPVMVRVSFNLGGRGSFVAWSREELSKRLVKAFAHSEVGNLLIEKYLDGWKEIEFEVVRDAYGNAVAVACLENVDPMGVHTGESIVVAPCQTINDEEYQILRAASIGVARAINLVGEGNVQLALDPNSTTFYVIETNPRMSRSSALASKATGYPLAYIATKLALGYRLYEILNQVTKRTTACFEPSLDYIVVKIPRWDLEKFPGIERSIGTEMMSVGEVMAIGRNFAEALQKAVRMLDVGEDGVVGRWIVEGCESLDEVLEKLRRREPYWPIHAAKALWLGASLDDIQRLLKVDRFFLREIERIVELARELLNSRGKSLEEIEDLLWSAKEMGFSDTQIATLLGIEEERVREFRERRGIRPRVKRIDTLAAEWPAQTNYLYTSYGAQEDDVEPEERPSVIVVGAGTFRIGVSVEFDWATVNLVWALRDRGYRVILVNYNPETVSTDWDTSDRLYFEEITLERVRDIYLFERPIGVITFVGGQIGNNIAGKLEASGIPVLGSSGRSVDIAENRARFSELLESLGIDQPPWIEVESIEEALRFGEEVGYPLLLRPSYVIGGMSMFIVRSPEELVKLLRTVLRKRRRGPIVLSKFIEGGIEAEIDGVGDGRSTIGIVVEHIEKPGVHSGDSTMVTPPRRLPNKAVDEMKRVALSLVEALEIRGPYNIQFIARNGRVYVLELNLRASRSMPFTSKSRGVNLMDLAARVVLGERLGVDGFYEPEPRCFAVKSPQFSWAQLRGAYPFLGPEMRSTGEVASMSRVYEAALLKSWLAAQPNRLLEPGSRVLVYSYDHGAKPVLSRAIEALLRAGIEVVTLNDESMLDAGSKPVDSATAMELIRRRRVDAVITTGYHPEKDYRIRRLAADLRIPLILEENLALELARAHAWLYEGGSLDVDELRSYWR